MTKNTPRIFISLLLMLLCIGILPVSAFASGGDYPDDTLPAAESSAADAQKAKQMMLSTRPMPRSISPLAWSWRLTDGSLSLTA